MFFSAPDAGGPCRVTSERPRRLPASGVNTAVAGPLDASLHSSNAGRKCSPLASNAGRTTGLIARSQGSGAFCHQRDNPGWNVPIGKRLPTPFALSQIFCQRSESLPVVPPITVVGFAVATAGASGLEGPAPVAATLPSLLRLLLGAHREHLFYPTYRAVSDAGRRPSAAGVRHVDRLPDRRGGQTLPSPYHLTDDVQYYAPGPEFKLSNEAAALAEQRAQEISEPQAAQLP